MAKEKQRFENKIYKEEITGCWLWKAYKDKDGYGTFSWEGYPMQAHRASWKIYCGPIPEGKLVCHTCDTPSCVNPNHLFIGNNSDNMIDMQTKNRANYAKGTGVKHAKLTEQDVKTIRTSPLNNTQLAIIFNVERTNIVAIKKYKTWKHV